MTQPHWIWHPTAAAVNAYVEFDLAFTVEDAAQPVSLLISASGQYACFLQEKMVATGQYADWPAHKVYQTHDITADCAAGENLLRVRVYHQGIDCHVDVARMPGLYCSITQGDDTLCASDAGVPCAVITGYQQGEMARITPQLGFGFGYTAGAAPAERASSIVQEAPAPQIPRPIAPLRIEAAPKATMVSQGVFFDTNTDTTMTIAQRMQLAALAFRPIEPPWPTLAVDGAPLSLTADGGDGCYCVIDLGEETSGLFHLDIECDDATDIHIGFGEHLSDLRVRTEIDGRNFAVRYTASAGANRFTHWYKPLGARYLQLHIFAGACRLRYAGLLPLRYPVDMRPTFHCTEALHERIWTVGRSTLINCMRTHYEDCPWREQALYAYDARVQMLCGYYAFGETTFARENLRLLAQGQRADGLLEMCAPAKIEITIPGFSLAFIMALEEYCLYSGDLDFARDMLPVAEDILSAYAKRRTEGGLVSNFVELGYWNFYEWQPGLDGGEIFASDAHPQRLEAPLNALLSLALRSLSRLYEWLDDATAAGRCLAWRTDIHAGLERFWQADKGVYAAFDKDGALSCDAELTQALLLCAGAVPEERVSALQQVLLAGNLTPVTLCNALFKYEALLLSGQTHAQAVVDDISRTWGGMLEAGATTFWETALGERDFHGAGSLCHGWSTVPIYITCAHLLGYKPTSPGVFPPSPTPLRTTLSPISATFKTPVGYVDIAE